MNNSQTKRSVFLGSPGSVADDSSLDNRIFSCLIIPMINEIPPALVSFLNEALPGGDWSSPKYFIGQVLQTASILVYAKTLTMKNNDKTKNQLFLLSVTSRAMVGITFLMMNALVPVVLRAVSVIRDLTNAAIHRYKMKNPEKNIKVGEGSLLALWLTLNTVGSVATSQFNPASVVGFGASTLVLLAMYHNTKIKTPASEDVYRIANIIANGGWIYVNHEIGSVMGVWGSVFLTAVAAHNLAFKPKSETNVSNFNKYMPKIMDTIRYALTGKSLEQTAIDNFVKSIQK